MELNKIDLPVLSCSKICPKESTSHLSSANASVSAYTWRSLASDAFLHLLKRAVEISLRPGEAPVSDVLTGNEQKTAQPDYYFSTVLHTLHTLSQYMSQSP